MPSKVVGKVTGGTVAPSPFAIGPLSNTGRAELRFKPSFIAHQSWVNPVVGATNAYVTAKTSTALPAAAGSVTFSPDGAVAAADYARNVTITVTHGSSVVAASGVITGKDEYGTTITEAWSVTATGTSKTYTGKKAFAYITSVTYVTAADATANTFVCGTGNVFGLNFVCSCPSGVKETSGGTVVTNGTVVAGSTASTDDLRGTYAPNAAPNGTLDFELWYLANEPSTGT